MEITEVATATDCAVVRALLRAYEAALGVDLGFQGFEDELDALPGGCVRPAGILLLARDGKEYLGCVAVHAWAAPDIAELKRLYVRPAARGRHVGRHVGRLLTQTALAFAQSAGYATVRLDTLPSMHAAHAMYAAGRDPRTRTRG